MKVTLTAIKADAGGIGGNTRPSDNLLLKVKNHLVSSSKRSLIDYYIEGWWN